MITGWVVLKMVLMPSSTRLVILANSGPRWSISGMSMARSTRSGTGVGPGICRKWRPGRREAFCGMSALLRIALQIRTALWKFRLRPKAVRRRFDPRMPRAGQVSSLPQVDTSRRWADDGQRPNDSVRRLTINAQRAFVPAAQRQIIDQRQQIENHDAGDRQQQKRGEHAWDIEAVAGFGDAIGETGAGARRARRYFGNHRADQRQSAGD